LFNYKFILGKGGAYTEGLCGFNNILNYNIISKSSVNGFIGGFLEVNKKKISSGVARSRGLSGFLLKSRIDVFLRLLIPGCVFYILKKKISTFFFFFSSVILWPKEYLDILGLLLYSNTVFANTSLFDLSGAMNLKKKKTGFFMYYVFKVPTFSTWVVAFIETELTSTGRRNLVSLEALFKSSAWAEREASELFGIFFFLKVSNRKLITDYFFKIYPMLK